LWPTPYAFARTSTAILAYTNFNLDTVKQLRAINLQKGEAPASKLHVEIERIGQRHARHSGMAINDAGRASSWFCR
jgi:hypothetical protein